MATWGPILLYLAVFIWSGIITLPLLRLVFDDVRRVPLISVSLTVGAPLTVTAFSLLARLNPNYSITVPVLLIGGTVVSGMLHFLSNHGKDHPRWDIKSDFLILGLTSLLLLVITSIRANWPGIFFSHNEAPFNFSIVQAFVYGQGFPPEDLWNRGEPVNYYLLLHTLPGLIAWGWRILSGDPGAGSILFVFSDGFLFLWGGFSLIAWGYTLLCRFSPQLTRHQALALAAILGGSALIGVHASAMERVVSSWFLKTPPVSWTELKFGSIGGTLTYYPLFTLLPGEHHPFQRVAFLQIAVISSLLLLLGAQRFHPSRIILAAGLAASLLLAHPGSAMIDVIIGAPAALIVCAMLVFRKRWRELKSLLVNAIGAALLAGLLSVPTLLARQPTMADWYAVERSIASPLRGFLAAQFAPLVFFALAASTFLFVNKRAKRIEISISITLLSISLIGVIFRFYDAAFLAFTLGAGLSLWMIRPKKSALYRWHWLRFIALVLVVVCMLTLIALGRPAVTVALICMTILLLTTERSNYEQLILTAIGCSFFLTWVIPEFVVVEWPFLGQTTSKRFNITMRFWLEGYYIIPFLGLLAWSPNLPVILDRRIPRRLYTGVIAMIGLLWIGVHQVAIADRIVTSKDLPGLDGAAHLTHSMPRDAAIVNYLKQVPGTIHIGELCGTGEIIPKLPTLYDWPGRIAAYSARPGLCGWTRHIWGFGPRLNNPSATGPWSWVRFREYERHLNTAYLASMNGSQAVASRDFFSELGITHLIVGEGEQKLFPALTAQGLANAVQGTVVFSGDAGSGVVALNESL